METTSSTTTATATVEQSMTEMFNRIAFHAETPDEFTAAIAGVFAMMSERPAVASEWARFCAERFAEVVA